MRSFTFQETVEHRGVTLTIRGARGKLSHRVTVNDGQSIRGFDLFGRFSPCELRNRAVERFSGLESR